MFTLYSCNIFFKCTLTRHLFSLTLKYFFFYKSSKSKKKTKPSSSEIIKTQRKQVNRSAKTKKRAYNKMTPYLKDLCQCNLRHNSFKVAPLASSLLRFDFISTGHHNIIRSTHLDKIK